MDAEGYFGVLRGGVSVFYPVDPNRAPIILPTTGTRPHPISTIVNTRLMQRYITTLNINGVPTMYKALDEVLVDGVWTKVDQPIYIDVVDAPEGKDKVRVGGMEGGVGNNMEKTVEDGDRTEEKDGGVGNNMESAEKDGDEVGTEGLAGTDTKSSVVRRRRSRRSSSSSIAGEDMEGLEADGVEEETDTEIKGDGDEEETEMQRKVEDEEEMTSSSLEMTYPDGELA